MPRPSKLGPYKIVGFAIEIEYYNILKELALRSGVTVSELLRKIVYDYLREHGLMEAEIIASDGGINTLSALEQKMLSVQLKDLINELERIVKSLQSMPKKARGTITWYDKVTRLDNGINKALALLKRLGVPSDNLIKRLNKIIEFRETINK